MNPLHACVPGCELCAGREAANECLVTLPLSHSEKPKCMQAVEMVNTAHQILSAAALVSPVWEADTPIIHKREKRCTFMHAACSILFNTDIHA